eukprot:gnl/Chilomastix_caulleri/2232.p2 GENE.gnl/Chilomastix_caulleri/2232~~gnl/Chilomastix_caulleri/2232.p2  ORF type:complete len:55 (+),score=4.47 gnl/Chilomastix_caulleri/2232:247-411(+)
MTLYIKEENIQVSIPTRKMDNRKSIHNRKGTNDKPITHTKCYGIYFLAIQQWAL